MENRFEMLQQAKLTHAEKIPALPRILVVIDEIADLIVQDRNHDWEFQTKMIAIAQKCRAAGISLVIATQRPSVNIISGIIKANFPTRIACRVSSKADSRVILDAPGAESLLGRGDAIIDSRENSKVRFKFAATSIANLFEYLRLPVPDLKG
jgi:DNA segregation ATPase FtsK/SpoIIIE, S-DNA-T family